MIDILIPINQLLAQRCEGWVSRTSARLPIFTYANNTNAYATITLLAVRIYLSKAGKNTLRV